MNFHGKITLKLNKIILMRIQEVPIDLIQWNKRTLLLNYTVPEKHLLGLAKI
jgi:hypothetical protein